MSKTFNTLKFLNENKIDYTYINSYSTPLSFYSLLYENATKKVIVFDDVSSVSNPLIISLLKSACWSLNNKRIVSYYSTSKILEQRELPSSFEFDANVILIFNHEYSGYEAVINRGIKIDFNFSYEEKLKIFEELKKEASIEEDILEYVKNNCNSSTSNLSIRSLVILSDLRRGKYDFKLFAKEILKNDEEIEMLISLNYKEWKLKTGGSISKYYRRKRKYGIK